MRSRRASASSPRSAKCRRSFSARASISSTRSQGSWRRATTAPWSSRSKPTISATMPGVSRCTRPRVRLLLRRRSRGGLRLPDAQALSRSPRVSHRRDHPQPARQRPAARAGHPLPERRRRARHDAGTRRCGDSPRVWRHHRAAAVVRACGVHARGHDLWLRAQRLEERHALCARRLHVHHPRQVPARGNTRHRLAGAGRARRQIPRRARQDRSARGLRLHP